MELNNKRYDMINVMRLVFALLIIGIHTSMLGSFGMEANFAITGTVARLGVPFFFVTAGFFFYNRINEKGYTKDYVIKIFKIYAIWTIAYGAILFQLVSQRIDGFGGLFKALIGTGVAPSLWYLPALIFSIIVVGIFMKKGWDKPLIILSVILLILGALGDTYMNLIEGTLFINIINGYNYIFTRSIQGITFGVPFITAGVMINKYKLYEKIKNVNILLVVAVVIFIVEVAIVIGLKTGIDFNMYISLIFLAPILFIKLLDSKVQLNEKTSNMIRDMSLTVYCVHEMVQMTTYRFLPSVAMNSLIAYIFISGVSVAIAFGIYKLKTLESYKGLVKKTAIILSLLLVFNIISSVTKNKNSDIVGVSYRISDGDSSIVIHGIFNYGEPGLCPLNEGVDKEYEESEVVLIEDVGVNMDQEKIIKALTYPNGETLEQRVSPESFNLLKEKLNKAGYKYEDVKTTRIAFLAEAIELNITSNNPANSNNSSMVYYMNKTFKDKKTIKYMGNFEEYLMNYSNTTKEDEEAFVKILKFIDDSGKEKLKEAYEAWKVGDIDKVVTIMDNIYAVKEDNKKEFEECKKIVENFYTKGSEKQIEYISKDLKEALKGNKKTFVLLSTPRLQGDNGVLKILEKEGFKIEKIQPINKK